MAVGELGEEVILVDFKQATENDRQDTLFGVLPIEEEIKIVKSASLDLQDAWSRAFVPAIIFDGEIVKQKLTSAKQKLNSLGI